MKWFLIKSVAFSIDREDKIDKESIPLKSVKWGTWSTTRWKKPENECDIITPTAASKRVSMVSV